VREDLCAVWGFAFRSPRELFRTRWRHGVIDSYSIRVDHGKNRYPSFVGLPSLGGRG